jgi:hypothetical protein
MAFLKKYALLILIPILVVLAALLAFRIVGSMDYRHNDNDFFTFWLAGHLVSQGGSPYDTAQWLNGYHLFDIGFIPNPAFLYPYPLALLLVPLGLLPFHSAYILWVTLIQLMILFSLAILLLLEENSRAKLFFIPLLAGTALFRPTILTLTQGQVSGLFLFGLAWIAFFWQKGKWFWGGLLLGLLALKPNLGVLVIGLLLIWLLRQKRWTAFLGMLVSGIFILIAGLVANPEWISQYWHIGSTKLSNTFGGSPTVWGLGALISHYQPTGTLLIGGLAALFILAGFLWMIFLSRTVLRPVRVLALAVTITLLIAPYTWTYDQLLLILPITTLTIAMDQMGVRFPLTAVLFLGLDLLALVLLYFDTVLQVEILNVVIPAVILGQCFWYFNPRVPTTT